MSEETADEKPRFDLVPPDVLLDVVKVMTHGEGKYSHGNWETVEPSAHFAAAQRHLNAWHRGISKDEDSGLPHIAHAIARLMFLAALENDAAADIAAVAASRGEPTISLAQFRKELGV